GDATAAQLEPSQWTITPLAPAAQMLSLAVPQIACSVLVVVLGNCHHVRPSQWTISPASPTAHASLGVAPHAALRLLPCGSGLTQHQLPSLQIGPVPLAGPPLPGLVEPSPLLLSLDVPASGSLPLAITRGSSHALTSVSAASAANRGNVTIANP